jgi:hypothetical protein
MNANVVFYQMALHSHLIKRGCRPASGFSLTAQEFKLHPGLFYAEKRCGNNANVHRHGCKVDSK